MSAQSEEDRIYIQYYIKNNDILENFSDDDLKNISYPYTHKKMTAPRVIAKIVALGDAPKTIQSEENEYIKIFLGKTTMTDKVPQQDLIDVGYFKSNSIYKSSSKSEHKSMHFVAQMDRQVNLSGKIEWKKGKELNHKYIEKQIANEIAIAYDSFSVKKLKDELLEYIKSGRIFISGGDFIIPFVC